MTAHDWLHGTSFHLGGAVCLRCRATVTYKLPLSHERVLELLSKEPSCDEHLVQKVIES